MGRFLLVVALCSLTGCATDGGVTSHSGPPSSPVSEVLQFTPFADTANNPSFGTRVTDSADNTLTVTIRFVDGEPWLVLDATNATGETATLTLDPASLNQETSPDRDLFAEAGMVLDGTPLQAAFNGDDVVEPLSSALDEATALFADQLASDSPRFGNECGSIGPTRRQAHVHFTNPRAIAKLQPGCEQRPK